MLAKIKAPATVYSRNSMWVMPTEINVMAISAIKTIR